MIYHNNSHTEHLPSHTIKRRVVVTGIGMVTPLAQGAVETWLRLLRGESGIRAITSFDASSLNSRIAGQVPCEKGLLKLDPWVSAVEQRRMGQFIRYALAAAREALEDSHWDPVTEDEQMRSGVSVGSGIGGLNEICLASQRLHKNYPQKGFNKVNPFFIPSALINLAAGHISILHKLKGPNHAVVTACASGNHAIGDALRFIQHGDADIMVAGGSEASVCPLGVAGFSAMNALSSQRNDAPHQASRPWDKDRDGFVIAEGAGFMVLEALEHARKRGVQKIYAELVGYGSSGDAYHITAPSPQGEGAYLSMKKALNNAQINPDDIGYINAHGTSTQVGDRSELKAVHRLFGEHCHKLVMSSTKSATGHMLGAAGGVEAIFSLLALRDKCVPPTLNLDNLSEETYVNLVPHVAQEHTLTYALSNSFGFGGTNASLIFKKFSS